MDRNKKGLQDDFIELPRYFGGNYQLNTHTNVQSEVFESSRFLFQNPWYPETTTDIGTS